MRQLVSPNGLTAVDGSLYYIDQDISVVNSFLPWKIVGDVPQRISMISNLPNNPSFSASSLFNVNGTIYFRGLDRLGAELWKVNHTNLTASIVKDINTGVRSSDPKSFVNVGGTLYFTANDNVHGRELWKSDGTSSGTVMVKDIQLGTATSYPRALVERNGSLFFPRG